MSVATIALPEYLNVAEVAKLLDVHPRTVYNWINTGELPALHLGKTFRISATDLLNLTAKKPQ